MIASEILERTVADELIVLLRKLLGPIEVENIEEANNFDFLEYHGNAGPDSSTFI
jgi:hypothetical protein